MNEKKPTNPWAKSLLIWVGILLGLVIFVQLIGGSTKTATGEAIAYSEFVKQVDEGNVQSVTTASSTSGNQLITGKLEGGQTFRTTAPADAQVTDQPAETGTDTSETTVEESAPAPSESEPSGPVPSDGTDGPRPPVSGGDGTGGTQDIILPRIPRQP